MTSTVADDADRAFKARHWALWIKQSPPAAADGHHGPSWNTGGFPECWKRNHGPTIVVYRYNAADPSRTAVLNQQSFRVPDHLERKCLLVAARGAVES